MKRLLIKKITTINTPFSKAESLFQIKLGTHIIENYRADLTKLDPAKRHHDPKFWDIASLLRGNVTLEPLKSNLRPFRCIKDAII